VLQSGGDLILIPEKNKDFFDSYPDLYHQPFEDEGGEEVLADIFTWIEERL